MPGIAQTARVKKIRAELRAQFPNALVIGNYDCDFAACDCYTHDVYGVRAITVVVTTERTDDCKRCSGTSAQCRTCKNTARCVTCNREWPFVGSYDEVAWLWHAGVEV